MSLSNNPCLFLIAFIMTLGGYKPATGRMGGRPPAPPPPQEEAMPASDNPLDSLLDWGSSVTVSEEQTRVVRGETQEIEDSIAVIDKETKTEQTVDRQLRQDLSHAFTELTNLDRGAHDQIDNMQVHSTVIRGLEDTLHKDLVTASGVANVAVVSPMLPTRVRAKEDSQETDKEASPSYKTVIQERGAKLQEIATTLKSTSKELEDLLAQRRKAQEAIQAARQRMESESLEKVLEVKQQEAQRRKQELDQEQETLKATKDAIHKARAGRAMGAQKIADLVS